MSVRPPIDRSIDYSILLSRPAPSLIPSLTWCPLAESGTTSGRADRNDAISSKARVVDKAGSEESSEEGQIQDDRNHFEKAFRVPRYFDEEVVGADGLSSDATRRHALSFLVFSLSLSPVRSRRGRPMPPLRWPGPLCRTMQRPTQAASVPSLWSAGAPE